MPVNLQPCRVSTFTNSAFIRVLCSLFALYISFPSCCFAQNHKTDSLKKLITVSKDTARIDCLNALTVEYIYNEKRDSANYYASLAYEDSKKHNYIHGIAVAFSNKSQIAKHFDDDFVRSEKYARESLRWFEKTENKKGLEELYFYLLFNFVAQSKFDEGIYYGRKFYKWATEQGNDSLILNATGWLISLYRSRGDYETSFLYAQQHYEIAVKTKNKIWTSLSFYILAELYQLIDNYPEALNYFYKVLNMDDSVIVQDRIRTDNDIWFRMEFAETFAHLNQFDSAWYYYNAFNPGKESIYYRVYLVSTGECYLLQKKYREALRNLLQGLYLHKEKNDRNEIMRAQLDIAKIYLAQQNYPTALTYCREGLAIALETKTRHVTRDAYQILYSVFDKTHKNDSAYYYYKRYISMKDAVLNDQTKGKFAAYNYEKKIESINKEKENQQTRLENEMFTKKILIGGILVLSLLGIIIFRNIILKRRNEKQRLEHEIEIQKLESERTKAELQHQARELEMQALRTQMNPHFIFNSLNSINRFILQNNKDQASEYLTKFSKLVRLILQNSNASLITLESEIEALKLYLELESLRFNHRFNFTISADDEIDAEVVKVPPLIIQPYAENAIWHGLMHKAGVGNLEIMIKEEENFLQIKISDDGIGRKKAAELKSKSATTHKSMGLKITEDRIAMMNREENKGVVVINDLVLADGTSGGTQVILKIPVVQ